MKIGRKLSVVIFLILILTLTFTIVLHAEVKFPLTIKAGHVVPSNFLYDVGLRKFKEIVEEGSNGDIKIEIYPQGQLGSERELVEACGTGAVDMVVSNTAPISGFIPEIGIFSLPYVYQSRDAAYKVWDGVIGQKIMDKFTNFGVKALSLWDGGQRGIIGKHPIRKPEDLKGLKIRAMEDPVMLYNFRLMGALPTAIPWGECYTSLQLGVVDVLETCIQMMELNNFNEVAKYMSFTNHYWTPAAHIINLKLWNSLPLKYQTLIQSASYVGREFCRLDTDLGGKNSNKKALENLAKAGVEVVEVNEDDWKVVAKEVWDKFADKFGADRIQEIVNTK